jgi:hypothetical protein
MAASEEDSKPAACRSHTLILISFSSSIGGDFNVGSRVHVAGFRRCFVQNTDAPADASEAGARKSIPLHSKRYGLGSPTDKISFYTQM